MVTKYLCPKCGKTEAIRYGKFTLKDGKSVSRIRCKTCKKTSYIPYRNSFFNKMKTPEGKIHEALTLYIVLGSKYSIIKGVSKFYHATELTNSWFKLSRKSVLSSSYKQRKTIKYIANKLGTRPNTIINWINKVYDHPLEYKAYLKNTLQFAEPDAIKFFSNLRNTAKVRAAKAKKDALAKKLSAIFQYLDEADKRAVYRPVTSGRYKKDDYYRRRRRTSSELA